MRAELCISGVSKLEHDECSTRGSGDAGTEREGDAETERHGDAGISRPRVCASLRPRVSFSPHLPLTLITRLLHYFKYLDFFSRKCTTLKIDDQEVEQNSESGACS